MRITLIDPRGETKGWNSGLAYLAGSLLNNGHNVSVIDLNNCPQKAFERIAGIKSEIAGISLKSATISSAAKITDALNQNKNIRIKVCGGAHITVSGESFIKEHDFDAGFIGESEKTLGNYLEYLDGKISIGGVGAMWHHDKGTHEVRRLGEACGEGGHLDELPFPVYEVFDSFNGYIEDYPLVTSRGCPYQCIYCCVGKVSGKRWRARSIDNIIDELIRASERYRIRRFNIIDDNFTVDTDRAKDFCRKLIGMNFNKEWSCPNGVRADRLDGELLKLMKKSGCGSISIGVESGVERIFDSLKKGERLSDIEKTVRVAKEAGITVNGFFIIGLPGSTYEDDLRSVQYGRALGLDEMLFNIINIYPGTELWDMLQGDKNIRMLRSWTDSFHFGSEVRPVFDTANYPASLRTKVFYLSNLSQHHYMAIVGYSGSFAQKAFRLLKAFWTYDRRNILCHLAFIATHMRKVVRHAGKG